MPVNKNESLDVIIKEQHRDQDYLLHIYNRMRTGQNILLIASFGVLTYLTSSLGDQTKSLVERFFWPSEDYGRVIYILAAGFFVFGIIKLMIDVFGKHPWTTSYVADKDGYSHDPVETKEYFKARNDEVTKANGKSYFRHRDELTYLFYSITVSAIILIAMKTLG
jgi:hypothetical protein